MKTLTLNTVLPLVMFVVSGLAGATLAQQELDRTVRRW